jgi:hypothetical protein
VSDVGIECRCQLITERQLDKNGPRLMNKDENCGETTHFHPGSDERLSTATGDRHTPKTAHTATPPSFVDMLARLVDHSLEKLSSVQPSKCKTATTNAADVMPRFDKAEDVRIQNIKCP